MLHKSISFLPHIMFQEFDHESILLNINTQEHFGLDPVSTLFIKNIINGLTPLDACKVILKDYDVDEEQLHKDINELIESLVLKNLIEVS
ncbi:PqqD family protein [Sulfurimonas sp. MAG313]|nr:PqqD family protein [Sulfurimonas sp. MAG313]MDF1880469.1 PqqD family protein [Sulfurimonas sp. MAG313]